MRWPQQEEFTAARTADIDLSRFNDDYRRAQTEEAANAYSPVPDGRYRVIVENVELGTAKSTGNPLLKWRLRITSSPCQNRVLFKNSSITSNSIEWVKKELKVCGLDLEPFSDLPRKLGTLVGVELEISKATKGEYDNIYFNRRVTAQAAAELAELSDDLPF